MKVNALLSCISILIISSQSQILLPKIQAGIHNGVKRIENFASGIGLVKTTQAPNHHHQYPATNPGSASVPSDQSHDQKENHPAANLLPGSGFAQPHGHEAENHHHHTTTAANVIPESPAVHPDAVKTENSKPSVEPNNKPSVQTQNPAGDASEKVEDEKKLHEISPNVEVPPSPASTTFDTERSGTVKNNATAIGTDGSVVFPDDVHNPQAIVVGKNNSLACKPGEVYAQGHPCHRTPDQTQKKCVPGTVLDSNNNCRPVA